MHYICWLTGVDDMPREISKARMRRYMVLRLLFRCERDFDEIIRETGMIKIELVNVLQYLKRSRLLKREKNEKGDIYSLTERGEIRLAFFEYVYQLYEQWRPKWCYGENNGWEEAYCNEMNELIKKLNYFGYETVG